MNTRTLERNDWQPYLDGASRRFSGRGVELEILNHEDGRQFEGRLRRCFGMSYDPHTDSFQVISEKLEHTIEHPRQIFVAEEGEELQAVEVVEEDGTKHIIRVFDDRVPAM